MGGGGSSGGSAEVKTYEPVKTAQEAMKEASSETARAQQLRRGITSTFSRSTMGKTGGNTATSGSAAKLGG